MRKFILLIAFVLITSPVFATITGDNDAEFDDGTTWIISSSSAFGTRSDYSGGSGDSYLSLGYEDFEDQDGGNDGIQIFHDISVVSTDNLNNSSYHGSKGSQTTGGPGIGLSSPPTNDGYFVAARMKMAFNPFYGPNPWNYQFKIVKAGIQGNTPEVTFGKHFEAGGSRDYLVALDPGISTDRYGNATIMDDQQWHFIVMYFKPESSDPANDGLIYYRIDDTIFDGDLITGVDTTTDQGNDYSQGGFKFAHYPKGIGSPTYIDFVYMDQSGHQVFLGNSATFTSCTKLVPQRLNTWSASSINFKATVGDFSNGQNAYLYVTKDMTPTNVVGYPLVVGQTSSGGGGDDFIEPTVSNISPTDPTIGYSLSTGANFIYASIFDETGVDASEAEMDLNVAGEPDFGTINGSLSKTTVSATQVNISLHQSDLESSLFLNRALTEGDLISGVVRGKDTSGNLVEASIFIVMEVTASGDLVFSPGTEGDLDNYTLLSPSAFVVTDEMGNDVAQIISNDLPTPADLTLNMTAVYDDETYKDFEVSIDLRYDEPLESSTLEDMCLIFSYTDAETYYYWMVNNNTNYHRFYKVEGGVRTSLASSDRILITDNDFHEMKVSYYNRVVRFFFDNEKIMQVNDISLPQGKIGFGSYDQLISGDNVVYSQLNDTVGHDNDATTKATYFNGTGRIEYSGSEGVTTFS